MPEDGFRNLHYIVGRRKIAPRKGRQRADALNKTDARARRGAHVKLRPRTGQPNNLIDILDQQRIDSHVCRFGRDAVDLLRTG